MKSNHGATLIELTLYMGLLSIFTVALFNLFSLVLSSQTRSTATSLVQTNGNYLLARLSRDINRADSIVTPSSIGATSPTLTLRYNSTNFQYSLNNGVLEINDGTGSYRLNDTDTTISELNFRRLGNTNGKNSIQFSFSLASEVIDNSGPKSTYFFTTASTR